MKFKIDENLPVEISDLLLNNNYDSTTVMQQGMAGVDDTIIISVCKKEKRILVTLDTDFSDIRKYPPENYSGKFVMRIVNQSRNNILNVFQKIVPLLKREIIDKKFMDRRGK